MDPSIKAQDITHAGRGALIGAMFGSGWLGWGLGSANAFNSFVGPLFGFTSLFLLAGSIYFVRKGRLLRKRSPATSLSAPQIAWNRFLLVVLIEVTAIALATTIAYRLHRADLAANWCAMIVGLHFLPLARIFRAPRLTILGVLITAWCILCWALFRANALVISTSVGTGSLLWARCILSLLRARKIERTLST